MSVNGRDLDDAITPVVVPIANPVNREAATQLANLVVEANTHRSVVYAIYVTVCEMAGVVPAAILARLADEEERHIARAQLNLKSLRTVGT